MSLCFVDSNILVYGFVDEGDPRSEIARRLCEHGGAISVQCLNEFAHVAKRKFRLDWEQITDTLSIFEQLFEPIVSLDRSVHHIGVQLAQDYKLSVYDAMIVAAALTAGCDRLYSEDMHHGLVIDGRLTIENPFLPA